MPLVVSGWLHERLLSCFSWLGCWNATLHVEDQENLSITAESLTLSPEKQNASRCTRTLVISELHSVLVWRTKRGDEVDQRYGEAIQMRSGQSLQIRSGSSDLVKALVQSEQCVLAFKSIMKTDNAVQIVRLLLERAMPDCRWEEEEQGGRRCVVCSAIQQRIFLLDPESAIDTLQDEHTLDLTRVWAYLSDCGAGSFDSRSTVVLDCRRENTSHSENVMCVPKWREANDTHIHQKHSLLLGLLSNQIPVNLALGFTEEVISPSGSSPSASHPSFADLEHMRQSVQPAGWILPSGAPTIVTGSEFAASVAPLQTPIKWCDLDEGWQQLSGEGGVSILSCVMQLLKESPPTWGSVSVLILPKKAQLAKTHTDGKRLITTLKGKKVNTISDNVLTANGECTFVVSSSSGTFLDAAVVLGPPLDACKFFGGPNGKVQEALGVLWQLGIGIAIVRAEPGDICILSGELVRRGQGLRAVLQEQDARKQLFEKIHELDHVVASRQMKVVNMEDESRVKHIGMLLRRWIHTPSWESDVDLKVDEQPGVMFRMYVHDGAGVEVRVHLFEDASETYLHNHRTNFISHCLGGDYCHTAWHVVPSEDRYFEFNRTKDPQLKEPPTPRKGTLKPSIKHQHCRDLSYFISAYAFHKVCPVCDADAVLTVYVKGKSLITDTLVLTENQDLAWSKPNSMERELQGSARSTVLTEIRRIACQPQ